MKKSANAHQTVVVHMHKKFGKAIKMHKRNRTTVKSRYTGAHMSGKETRKYPVVLQPRRLEKMQFPFKLQLC